MQTRDGVEGLHNCLEISQPFSCLDEAIYVNTEKVLYCLNNLKYCRRWYGFGPSPPAQSLQLHATDQGGEGHRRPLKLYFSSGVGVRGELVQS